MGTKVDRQLAMRRYDWIAFSPWSSHEIIKEMETERRTGKFGMAVVKFSMFSHSVSWTWFVDLDIYFPSSFLSDDALSLPPLFTHHFEHYPHCTLLPAAYESPNHSWKCVMLEVISWRLLCCVASMILINATIGSGLLSLRKLLFLLKLLPSVINCHTSARYILGHTDKVS